jgi:serine-type D-Ala-D-Ala carboxypeptidase (penicillin-binding protein 5/6)
MIQSLSVRLLASALAATLLLGSVHAETKRSRRSPAGGPKPAPTQAAAEGASPRSTGTAVNAPAATGEAADGVLAPQIAARSWLLLDTTTGQTLAWAQPDLRIEPASLTKLMTAYLVFGALREGKLSKTSRPPVSQAAWKAIGSRMFVDPAAPASLEELLNGMIIQSGNDASIILAEAVAGSETGFAQLMNRQAERLGMTGSSFRNATGLPDPQHYTTAHDLGILASRLIKDFPQEYASYYSRKEYSYGGIRQPNRNRLLFIDPSVDGMKTGHTDAAGYCLIASAKREQPGTGIGRRLISVVLGTASDSARAIESQKLLNFGYQNWDAVRVFSKSQEAATLDVWKGQAPQLKAGFDEDVVVAVPKGQGERLKAEIERIKPLTAPIVKEQRVGTLRVRLGEKVLLERPLLALSEVQQAGLFGRLWDTIRLWISN